MLTTGDSPWETAVTQGTVSPAYGAKQTAAVVNFSVTVPLPAEHVIAFVSQESSELSRFEEVQIPGHDGVRGYRLDGTKRTRYVFFGQSEKWHCGPWASDARVLYCEIADGRLNHLIMISGSFAKWQNKEVYVHPTSVERFEWVNRRGRAEIFSSDPGAAGQQVESNFEFFNFVV
jgi:hypothetical protein